MKEKKQKDKGKNRYKIVKRSLRKKQRVNLKKATTIVSFSYDILLPDEFV